MTTEAYPGGRTTGEEGIAGEPLTDESGPLDNDQIQELIRQEVEAAKEYQLSIIAPMRALRMKRYRGDYYGNEEDGRSKVILHDFRDSVMAILPSLVRIFLASEKPVEFMPLKPGGEEMAAERTDYVSYVATEDNPGFEILYGAFKDALIRDWGILKWWWDESTEVSNETYTGLLADQVRQLSTDPQITEISFEKEGAPASKTVSEEPPTPPTPELADDTEGGEGATPPTYTVRLRREVKTGRARYQTVPGEEFFINREATTLEEASIISHIREVTRSELVAMGYDAEFIKEHERLGAFEFRMNIEYLTRRPLVTGLTTLATHETTNPNLETTLYGEHLIRLDQDGDGIAELHRICTLGDDYFVARIEDAPEINYAVICADPEPNQLFGNGLYSQTADLQEIKTAVLRASLDSLRLSIDPRTVVLEGQANLDDVLNHEIGAVIREQQPGAVRVLESNFVGQAGLTMLDYLDTIKEQRTGTTKGSQGLDADALQSTTKAAVTSQLSASQQRIEMIARVLAETGIKPLYKGLQRLIMRHQDVARTVRLRGHWINVDPRTWDAEMDVSVNVGVGMGLPEDRIARLSQIAGVQMQILTQMGPSPLVSFANLRYTLARGVELAGWNDPNAFFGVVPKDWAPPPPPQAQNDPATLLAQAQAQEIQAKMQIEQAKLQQAREQMFLDVETARMQIEANFRATIASAALKAGTDANQSQVEAIIDAQVEAMRAKTDAAIRAYEAEVQHRTAVATAPAPTPNGGQG